jgi:hypothetical protein
MKRKTSDLVIDLSLVDNVHALLPPCPAVGHGVHHARHGAICELALLGYSPNEIRQMISEWESNPEPEKIEESLRKVFAGGDPRNRNEIYEKALRWPATDFSRAITITRDHGRLEQAELVLKLAEASSTYTAGKDFQLSTAEWLSLFYQDSDLLCIGESFWDREVKPLSTWKKNLRYAHYISPNPFRSELWGRKNDNAIERRFLITEMDINGVQQLLLKSYQLDPFDVQAAVILHLKSLQKLRLLSVVWSGKKSLHALWKADKNESVNLEFMREAVALGVDKAGYTLSQFCRIYNPLENQPLFYLNADLTH